MINADHSGAHGHPQGVLRGASSALRSLDVGLVTPVLTRLAKPPRSGAEPWQYIPQD